MESIETYYIPSFRSKIAKGKLYDCYNNTRARLSALGIIKRSARVPRKISRSRSEGEFRDASLSESSHSQSEKTLDTMPVPQGHTETSIIENDEICVIKQEML